MDVQRSTSEGFARGSFTVEGLDTHRDNSLLVDFQNQNLIARLNAASLPACQISSAVWRLKACAHVIIAAGC